MLQTQRYISTELTHFLGRELRSDKERFDLLLSILEQEALRPAFGEDREHSVKLDPGRRQTTGDMYKTNAVCFCDIPMADLHIHMRKYSRFGIGFSKRYLARKGARPVLYVPNDANVRGRPFGDRVEEAVLGYNELLEEMTGVVQGSGVDHTDRARASRFVELGFDVLASAKFFDVSARERDEHNYYMEREWRAYGSVRFKVKKVRRTVMPREFIGRFLRTVGDDYQGEIVAAPRLPNA